MEKLACHARKTRSYHFQTLKRMGNNAIMTAHFLFVNGLNSGICRTRPTQSVSDAVSHHLKVRACTHLTGMSSIVNQLTIFQEKRSFSDIAPTAHAGVLGNPVLLECGGKKTLCLRRSTVRNAADPCPWYRLLIDAQTDDLEQKRESTFLLFTFLSIWRGARTKDIRLLSDR